MRQTDRQRERERERERKRVMNKKRGVENERIYDFVTLNVRECEKMRERKREREREKRERGERNEYKRGVIYDL